MPVPTLISELSTTANSNSPAGSESPVDGDNYLRAHAAFIAQLNSGKVSTSASLSVLGFTAAGSGAVSRTALAKTQEWVSAADYSSLQDAVDAVWNSGSGTGVVCVFTNQALTSALIMRSGVYVYCPSNATTITVSGAGQSWPLYGCVLFGGYSSPNFPRATSYALNATTKGAQTVTTTTAGHAGNFAAGDVVCVETSSTYDNGVDTIPTQIQMNVVESAVAGTGVVTLRHAIDESQSGAKIRKLNTATTMLDASSADTGVTLTAVRDCGIIGGTWIASTNEAPFCGAGGAVDCIIAPHRVIAASSPAYGNLYGYCRFSTATVQSRRYGIEIAFGSHGNSVEIGSITCEDAGLTVDRLCGVNEGARDNYIHVVDFNSGNDTAEEAVQISNSPRNRVIIDSLRGAEVDTVDGSTILIVYYAYSGTSPVPTDNYVEIGQSRITAQGRYLTMSEEADRNTIRGSFYGTINLTGAASAAGSDDNDIQIWCENGAPVLSAGCTGNRIAGTFGSDIVAPTDFTNLGANRYEYETASYKAFRALGYMLSTATYTSAGGLTKTVTFPAASTAVGDILTFKMSGVTNGSNGTKTLQLTFAGTLVLDLSGGSAIATGTQGVDVEVEIYIVNNTTATASVKSTIGATTTLSDVGITGLNFTTTQYTFVQTISVASAGDALVARTSRLACHRPFTNNVRWI